jgi:Secretion system C-terminal sorting domain/Domain of unknown function (DUF5122) beta-propeller
MKIFFLSFMLLFLGSVTAQAQTLQVGSSQYAFNGIVNTIVKDGTGNTYVGGNFTTVGISSGHFAKLNTTTGLNDNSIVKVAGGEINAVVAISDGGWYIGGTFTQINGISRNRLARVNADGSLHGFDPNMSSTVSSLTIDISGNLFAGGNFTTVGGSTTRNRLCKFDNMGVLTNFNPNMNGTVNAFVIDGSGNLFAGGNFTTVGGSTTRNRLCKFDNTGVLTNFDPNMNGTVNALVIDGSGNLYAGGFFGTVGGSTTRNCLCKFDNTGALTSFNPNMNSSIKTLALDSSGNLYAGGSFTALGGSTLRSYLCKFNNTGTLTNFNPNVNGPVNALVIDGSGNLFAGGNFTTVGGSTTRNRLCKFDNTGVVTNFNPNMNGRVNALALDSSENLYAGGNFTTVGGSARNRLCKFDNIGVLTNFDPNMGNSVYALAVDGSANLYAGGLFTTVGGSTTRNRLCKFDNTGTLTNFNPNINNTINTIALDGNGNLYAGGDFTTVSGSTTRNRLCKFDNIGVLTSFDPNINNTIIALTLDIDGNLYAGGNFTTVSGSTRNRLCKFDNTGVLTSFDPNMSDIISALALDGSGNLYAGGFFTSVGGSITRNRLCKFDNTGVLTSFDPNMSNTISALALDGSGNLYAGGFFTSVGGSITRNRLCKFDNTGVLTSFDPNMDNSVYTLALDINGNLYAGGAFILPTPYYAVFTVSCATPTAYTLTGGGAYCAGGAGVAVGLANSETGVTYQLQLGGANDGAAVSGTGTAISFGMKTAAGTYSVVATRTVGACTANMTGSAVVSTNALPIAYTLTGAAALCDGDQSEIALSNSEIGVSYQLQLDGANDGVAISGTGAAISFGMNAAAGTYSVVATHAVGGCTSAMSNTVVITHGANTTGNQSVMVCYTYTWAENGMTYTTSGIYSHITTNALGCTHTEILNLTIDFGFPNYTTETACDAYTWAINNTTYTTSGTYIVTNYVGGIYNCPHDEVLVLTINSATSRITNETACDTYTWAENGMTYTASGTYSHVTTNPWGCAHTEILNLTINTPTSSHVFANACTSYTWAINGTTYTTSGTYTHDTNVNGCTHTNYLHLHLNQVLYFSQTATACNSYTWQRNGQTYTQSGTYTYNDPNAGPCGSVETLILTINNNTTTTTDISVCTSYHWAIDNNTYYTSGTYTYGTTTNLGCTHTEILNLTILPAPLTFTNITACGSYTWGVSGDTYTTSGSYPVFNYIGGGSNCPHTEVLVLTISEQPVITTQPARIIMCAGSTGSATVVATGTGLTYQWQYSNNNGASVAGNAGDTGNNTATISDVPSTNVLLRCKITATGGCVVYSNWIGVTTNPLPTLTITGNTTGTGSVSLTADIGAGGTYVWSSGSTATAEANTFTTAGTYTVTVTATNAAGCSATATQIITVNACTVFPTAFPVTGTTTYCLNGIGKPVGLSGSELGVNYQMRYNGGNTPFGAVVAGTGGAITFGNQMFGATYTVVATNVTGCTALMTGNATLSVGVIPPAHIAGSTVACNTVSLTAYGGTTYTWSGGTTANTAANTFATSGIYTVTVATADGCSTTATRNITVNPLPNAAIAMVNNCNSTTLTASGGATYTWSGGSAPTAAINTISATGTYNVTVSNANGCSATASQVVTMPNVTAGIFGTLSGCGSAVLTANTIAGATYAWSGGDTPNAATNTVTATGTYTVTITSNGCSLSATRSVVVHPLPTANIISASPACNSGTSVLTATGGTTYTWSAGLSTTTATNTVNGSGIYTVTASNGNGCSKSASFTINAVPSPLISGHTTSCGTVSLKAYYANNPSGGTYAWSGGSTPNTDANAFTTSGVYTVTATSTAGCTATASVTITINPAPTVSIAGNAVSCGNAVLTASGGVSYRWSNGLSPNAASNTVTNVANYTVTVTNANGCTATTTFAVTAINAAVNPTVTGNATGCTSTTLTAGGGNTYAWSGGSAPTSNINTFTTSGTYTVTITRSNGCSATALRAISVGGTVMPMITTSNNPTCTGLTLTTNGGSSYAWSGGGVAATKAVATSGTYTVTVTTVTCGTGTASITVSTTAPTVTIAVPATNCNSATLTANSTSTGSFSWSNSETNATNTVLNAQIYTVTMTADNKCTATASKVVTISNVQANISGVNSACGTLTLTASGGTSYAWSGSGTTAAKTITTSGTYTVTATTGTCTATASKIVTIYANPTATIASSAVSCGVATLTATPTPAGTYTYTWPVGRNTVTTATNTVAIGGIYNVTVTDANGCTGATSFNLTLPNTSVGISGVTSGCGSVSLTAYGNGNASTYAWSGGGTGVVKAITTRGTYTVTITTGTCTATASQTVTINPAATATITSNTTACNSLSITASGGAYYAWSGGIAPTAAINTAIVTGTYTVTVTNSAGCTASTTRAVTINTLPTAGIIGTTTACGQVALVAIGNTGGSYTWSGGSTPSVAANTFTASGVYTVTVTQGVCGTATASRTVTINTAPTPSITGNSTGLGTVTLTASGGTYYAWNSGYSPTTAVNTGFLTNTYIVTVTNTNGCTATASKAVTITYSLPAPPVVAANTAQASHSPTAIDTEAYNTVLVYPNPITAGDLAMKINLIGDAITANISVLDIYGKVISTQTVTLQRGENTLALPLDNLAAGVYFISTTAQGQRFETKRVVKVGE